MLDFALSPILVWSAGLILAFPLLLAGIARIGPLRGRNPLQFLLASLALVSVWVVTLLATGAQTAGAMQVALALMLVAGGLLFYLEIWALLSRGYTLQILLTLYQAGGSLDPEEIARHYRTGDGIDWVFQHRIEGLAGAGMVDLAGGNVTLTRVRGVPVAILYLLIARFFGLRTTG